MAKFAVISNDKVVNIIIADSKEVAEEATQLECIQSDTACIDDTWDGTNFIKPEIEIIP